MAADLTLEHPTDTISMQELELDQESRASRLETKYPLLSYATRHWHSHVERSEEITYLIPIIRKITDSRWKNLRWWSFLKPLGEFRKISFDDPWQVAIELDIDWLAELLLTGEMQGFSNHITISSLPEMITVLRPKVLKWLLTFWGDKLQPSEQIVEQAFTPSIFTDRDIVRVLLDMWDGKIQITESIVMKAANHYSFQSTALFSLLEQQNTNFKVTENVLISAASNMCGVGAMEMLLNRRGGEFKITENVVETAARNPFDATNMLTLLLNRRENEVNITENVLRAAVRNLKPRRLLTLLLDRRADEVKITESILLAAVGGIDAKPVLTLLLDRRGDEIQITENILIAVVNGPKAEKTLNLLLDRRGDQVRITESILRAAIHKSEIILHIILERCGERIELTEVITLALNEDKHFCGLDVLPKLFNENFQTFCTALEMVLLRRDMGLNFMFRMWWRHGNWDKIIPELKLESPRTFELLQNSGAIGQSSNGTLSLSGCSGNLYASSSSSDDSLSLSDNSLFSPDGSDWDGYD